jgi:hypothetical protein
MWLFDSLVRWEHAHHREQWIRDGKPSGYFWKSAECVFWTSHNAMHTLQLSLLFKTPGWAAESPLCRAWLFKMRAVAAVWFAAWAVLLVIFINGLF